MVECCAVAFKNIFRLHHVQNRWTNSPGTCHFVPSGPMVEFSPAFLGLGRVIKDTMGLCVKETLLSLHPATRRARNFGQSPRKLSLWLRSEWCPLGSECEGGVRSSRAGSGSGGWSQHEVFLWTWEIYSPAVHCWGTTWAPPFLECVVSVCQTGVFQCAVDHTP